MLFLLNKTISDIRTQVDGLRQAYTAEYGLLRDPKIRLPKGDKLNPAQLTMLAEACALAREYSDLASRYEGKWFQVWKEFELLLKHKKNKLLEFEWEDRVTRKAELAGGSKEDRTIILQSFRKQEWSEYLEIEAFSEEMNACYTWMKNKHVAIRRAQDDINTYLAMIRSSMFDRSFNPPSPDNVHRSVENLNHERKAGYDLLNNPNGPDPMGHRSELLGSTDYSAGSKNVETDTNNNGTVTL